MYKRQLMYKIEAFRYEKKIR